MQEKTPSDTLREILQQRGKIITFEDNSFRETFLKFILKMRGNRDFLYAELSNRQQRNELLYSIYNNTDIKLSDGTAIAANDGNRFLYSKTFEWYVAELLYREFQFFATAHGIKIKDAPEGGDFDVIGATHSEIMTVECKSGKPSGIDEAQITQFIKRHNFLRADYSIMYIDYKGLHDAFSFSSFVRAIHGENSAYNVYKIEAENSGSNANFYAVEGSHIYVVDNSKSSGNVIKNLRFAIDTHYALKASRNRSFKFDQNILRKSFNLNMKVI